MTMPVFVIMTTLQIMNDVEVTLVGGHQEHIVPVWRCICGA